MGKEWVLGVTIDMAVYGYAQACAMRLSKAGLRRALIPRSELEKRTVEHEDL